MNTLRAIHAAKSRIGLDDDAYRDLLERETGKRSSKDLTESQRKAFLTTLNEMGGARPRLDGKYAGKLQALWIAAWNLGIVRDKRDAAMLAFIRRQTGIDHTRFLRDPMDADKVVEALKAWLAREGGVDWSFDRRRPDWTQTNGYRIASAQWALLEKHGATGDYTGLSQWMFRNSLDWPSTQTNRGWITVMNTLGKQVRAARKGAG